MVLTALAQRAPDPTSTAQPQTNPFCQKQPVTSVRTLNRSSNPPTVAIKLAKSAPLPAPGLHATTWLAGEPEVSLNHATRRSMRHDNAAQNGAQEVANDDMHDDGAHEDAHQVVCADAHAVEHALGNATMHGSCRISFCI